ncbi:DUF6506 family protein [Cellulomonas fimi]|uniref:DUF6506 family protein n=1 Tax=Cellulomonas fimi TaxID=1708 RepID=UPI00234D013C|nr:DUF6506 family protein [Cellulomonas fimi]MDC7122532.1 DUF6506 family protein [Cellulomonas fimi]
MGDPIVEHINNDKFGTPDAEKYWWHHAFIFRCSSTIHPVLHLTTLTTPDGKMTVCPVSGDEDGPNLEQAIAVAKRLAFEGANKIDLCSGFNAKLAKAIQEAVGDSSKVAVSIRANEL